MRGGWGRTLRMGREPAPMLAHLSPDGRRCLGQHLRCEGARSDRFGGRAQEPDGVEGQGSSRSGWTIDVRRSS